MSSSSRLSKPNISSTTSLGRPLRPTFISSSYTSHKEYISSFTNKEAMNTEFSFSSQLFDESFITLNDLPFFVVARFQGEQFHLSQQDEEYHNRPLEFDFEEWINKEGELIINDFQIGKFQLIKKDHLFFLKILCAPEYSTIFPAYMTATFSHISATTPRS